MEALTLEINRKKALFFWEVYNDTLIKCMTQIQMDGTTKSLCRDLFKLKDALIILCIQLDYNEMMQLYIYVGLKVS